MKLLSSVGLWIRRLLILVWKNVHLRWRTSSVGVSHRLIGRVPIFLLIEVLWPLLLYTIIALLRLNFPPQERGVDLWRPVALPSAGTLPFIQSLICDLDQKGSRYGYQAMPSYPNATVNDVYSLLDEFGSLNGTLDTFCSTIHSLSDTTSCLTATVPPKCQKDVVPLTCFLDNPASFETFLTLELHFSPRLAKGIVGATVDTNNGLASGGLPFRGKRQLPGFPSLGGLSDALITPDGLRAVLCTGNGSLLNGLVEFQNISAGDVSVAVCALNTTQMNALAVELQQQISLPTDCNPLDGLSSITSFEKGRDLLLKFSNLSTDGLFNGINDINSTNGSGRDANGSLTLDSITMASRFFCGDIETNKTSLLLLLFQALYGNDYQQDKFEQDGGNLSIIPDHIAMKILYAPNNNHTANIMTRASRTFQTFAYIQDWAEQIANCSNDFLVNFPPNSTQASNARTLVSLLLDNSTTTNDTRLTQLLGNNSSQASLILFNLGLGQLRQNVSVDNLEYMQGLLNETAPGNIWEVVTNVRDVADSIHDMLSRFDWDVFYPMPDEASLDSLAVDYERQSELNFTTVFAGVVFEGVEENGNITNATIKIRMNSTSIVDPTELAATVWTPGPETSGWKKAYVTKGFTFLQDMVERAVAEEMVGHTIPTPGLYLQQMPYPCYQHDRYVVAMEFVLALAMLFAWLFPVAMTVRAIVREKEARLKEYIKMVGVSDTQLRLSRFLVSGTILLVSVCFITFILKVGNILPLTDWSLLFVYLCLYALVMLAYSFLVSTMFTNANLAACVASLIYFMVLFGHTILVSKQQDMSPFTVGLACLWAPLGFAMGAQYMVQWEVRQEGLQWANMHLLSGTDSQLSFLSIIIILCVDTALYFLATWYIEGVAPGRYGVAKPWYFPVMPSYWLGQSGRGWFKGHTEHQPLENEDGFQAGVTGPVCEEEPLGLPLGIAMSHLTKVYSSCRKRKRVTAIKDLSLNFYEGQITTLLGHNGAGKTTTLSILAGLFEPTSGTARIYGNSIRRHMDSIRQGLGICPQHNILFSELTVEEHLLFYGQLKGLSWKESISQIPEWLSKVDLLPHATKLAKHLSGGMKRKLSILLAFVGGSRTVILDEPTAGVDPYARRQIWDFLLRQREGRTIILSTHHMDEAEILGDRIAIISQGSLICCGSFEFLKHRFGQGHRLTLLTTSSEGACEEDVGAFLVGHVRGVKLLEVRGPELHYLLPLSGAKPSVLTQLFRELEAAKVQLGVVSYGLTSCSMEEIFVELTEKDENKSDEEGLVPRPSVTSMDTTPTLTTPTDDDPADDAAFDESPLFGERHAEFDRLSRGPLWFSQFTALIVKRFHYTRRRLLALVIQNVLPLFVLGLSLLIAHLLQTVTDPPPIELTPNLIFSINKNNYIFAGGYNSNETDKYIQTLFQPCGIGGHSTSADPSKCYHDDSYNASSAYYCPNYPPHTPLCTCSQGCNTSVPFPPQPSCYNGTGTGSRVQNLTTSFDPNNPFAADETLTNYLLQSKQAFVQQRYGGLSFGLVRSEVDESLDAESKPFLAVREAAKVWYSLKSYHSVPSFVNVMNNALMRGELGADKQQSQYGFKTISHPFPTSDLWKIDYAIKENASFLVNPMALMFSLGFVVAGFVLILIEERSGNVKHLQLICGMNKIVYWLANFTWDLLWYIGFTLLTLALYLAFQDPFYTGSDVLPLFLLILLAYGLAVIPWIYVMSFLFQSPATAYVVLFCLNFLGGFSILIVDAILLFINTDLTMNHLKYYLGLIPMPSYILARGSMYIASDYPLYKVAASFGAVDLPNPYAELAPFLAALLGQAIFYTIILVLIEMWPYLRGLICRGRGCSRNDVTSLPLPLDDDEDVRAERSKVTSDDGDSEILRMNGLSRVYRTNLGRSRRVAVNQLCLRVNKGECFGLLGVNGAGKTTTFKMLTGDIVPSAGDAVIAGHTLSTSRGRVQQSIGYCPQVDALIDQLTGRQHLVLFCRLRGLRGADLKGVVEEALDKLGLSAYADRPVGAYSGGNRRKLSTAIALLANPPLVLLDEPTSGVDPRARHFLWSLIRRLVADSTQSVVLTTHSMAECEALCSRVAIMVNGEFHCLGSPQQLKSTYGSGYKLKLRVGGQVEPVKEFVRQNMPGAVLQEEHYTTLVYQLLSSESLLLHNVLEIMEQARETLDIQDYSVSQTTLDDVFIHFANEQSEEVGIMRGAAPTDEMLPDLVPLGPIEHTSQTMGDDEQATQL